MRGAGAGGERVPRLVVSDFEFGTDDRERLSAALGVDGLLLVRGVDGMRAALRTHPESDVLCTYRPPADSYTLGAGIRWLALPSAGADGAVRAGLVRPGGPVVTDARGVHAGPIGEFVFSVLLLWARNWPVMLAEQRERTWPAREARRLLSGRELRGTTLGIVGLGAIGREVSRLGRGFGMRVIATRRSVAAGERDADVDALLPVERLRELLGASDYVVIATPSTP
jgi:phosphoglycerate dehydrogenase-like enzyme